MTLSARNDPFCEKCGLLREMRTFRKEGWVSGTVVYNKVKTASWAVVLQWYLNRTV